MFRHIPSYLGDPIYSLFQEFLADPSPHRVNLSIGLYYDEEGRLPVLSSVRRAAQRLSEEGMPYGYLPMEGMAFYRQRAQELVFGADSVALREGRIATVQSVGGSGALRLVAEFLRRYFPDSAVWISDPTWDNHRVLFTRAGLEVHNYPYYDPQTHGLCFDAMVSALAALPSRSVVVMQPSCHNPTGVDLSKEQWKAIIQLMVERGLMPLMDMAYQGFGDGLAEDAWAIRAMCDAGLAVMVSHSFSKNFALYGERCGGLSVVCADNTQAAGVLSQLQAIVRGIYSSPPLHGARLVATVLGDADLRAQWEGEVNAMRQRIQRVRGALQTRLAEALPDVSFDHLGMQRGMFSYTGLSPALVDALRTEKSVYLLRSGRACMAGLNDTNIDWVAKAIGEVVRKQTRAAVTSGAASQRRTG